MKEHILIIDDDSGIRSLLEFYLGKYYTVTCKGNGLDAMLWLENGNLPSLIIADINMPEIGGYEFLKLIRSSGFFQDIPVIVLTGMNELEVRESFSQYSIEGFITKPFNPDHLLSQIEKVLNAEVPASFYSTVNNEA